MKKAQVGIKLMGTRDGTPIEARVGDEVRH